MQVSAIPWARIAGAALGACLSVLPAAAQEPELPRIRVNVRMVLLPTRVSDAAGQPVFNLAPEDFRIREDGKEQKLEFFALTSEPAHIALVVDTSGSTSEMLPELRLAAQQFVDRFGAADRIALYGVDTDVTRVCPFTGDFPAVKAQIARMSPRNAARDAPGAVVLRAARGGTLLYDAIAAVRREFPSEAKKRAILLFTDSWDIGSVLSYDELAWQVMGGSEMLFAVVADLRRQESPQGPRQLSLMRPPTTQRDASPEPGAVQRAVVLDLTAVSPQQLPAFEAAVQDFLFQLGPLDRVWLFVKRQHLRLLVPRDSVARGESLHPRTPEEARQLLPMIRLAENALPTVLLDAGALRPDHLLILTETKQAGLGELAGFITLAPTAILQPEALGPDGFQKEMAKLLNEPAARKQYDQEALESVLQLMENRLRTLAAETGGDSFQIEYAAELQKAYQRIADQIRSSFLLGYYTTGAPGMRKLEVRVPSQPVRVHARRAVVVRQ